jgi:hypothetical protein
VHFLDTPDVQSRLLSAGMEAAPGSPAALTTLVKSEMARIGKVIKQSGVMRSRKCSRIRSHHREFRLWQTTRSARATFGVSGVHMFGILDPTIAAPRTHIDYTPRPRELRGLRIGLIENTKKNSEEVLRALGDTAARRHDMSVQVLVHKSQRAPLKDSQIAALKDTTDFAIVGVGD